MADTGNKGVSKVSRSRKGGATAKKTAGSTAKKAAGRTAKKTAGSTAKKAAGRTAKKTAGSTAKKAAGSTAKKAAGRTAKKKPEDETDVQRIEALEAKVDVLQTNVVELGRSLKELVNIGISEEGIRDILSSSIEGDVTGVKDGKILGWAINLVDQISILPISVFYRGKKVVTTIANRTLEEHKGVALAGGNSFSIILPRQFYDGKARSLQYKAGEVEATIGNSLGAVSFADGFPLEGGLSSSEGGVIEGWAVDHSNPKAPVIVSAVYGSEEIGKTVADLKDNSLSGKLGKTNCHHAFRLQMPKNLGDGKKRNIRIVALPWGYEILEGPVECKFSK